MQGLELAAVEEDAHVVRVDADAAAHETLGPAELRALGHEDLLDECVLGGKLEEEGEGAALLLGAERLLGCLL